MDNSYKPNNSLDNRIKQIEQIRLSLRSAMSEVMDSKLDDLETKFRSKPKYHLKLASGDQEEIIPLLMAGMKRRPELPYWLIALYMFPFTNRRAVTALSQDEKIMRYLYTFAYLQEATELLQATSNPEPNQADSIALLKSPMAFAALEIGELNLSRKIAKEILLDNNDPCSWNYGNVIHEANTILGRVSLRENDPEKAKHYLLESGKTPGSPQLNSFGPSFMLARELLEKGEKDVVIKYLDLVAVFWANPDETDANYKDSARRHAAELSIWKQKIKEGKIIDNVKWLMK